MVFLDSYWMLYLMLKETSRACNIGLYICLYVYMIYKNVREENNENIFPGIYAEQAEHWNFSIRSSKKSYQNKVTEFGVGFGKYHMLPQENQPIPVFFPDSRILPQFLNPFLPIFKLFSRILS